MNNLITEQEITPLLVEKIREKDSKTIALIYKEIYPMVRKYVIQNNGSDVDAQDVFQDALYVLIKKTQSPSFTLTSKLSTYVFGISKNLWLKLLTRKSIDLGELAEEQKSYEDTGSGDIKNVLRTKKMHQCLLEIGEPCRTILEQFYFLKTSMKEIAEMLHYSNANNAKNQKYKCFMRLKKRMIGNKE